MCKVAGADSGMEQLFVDCEVVAVDSLDGFDDVVLVQIGQFPDDRVVHIAEEEQVVLFEAGAPKFFKQKFQVFRAGLWRLDLASFKHHIGGLILDILG